MEEHVDATTHRDLEPIETQLQGPPLRLGGVGAWVGPSIRMRRKGSGLWFRTTRQIARFYIEVELVPSVSVSVSPPVVSDSVMSVVPKVSESGLP